MKITIAGIIAVAFALGFALPAHGAFIVKPASPYNDQTYVPVATSSPEIERTTASSTTRTVKSSDDDVIEKARIEELKKIIVQLTELLNTLLAQKRG